MLQRPDWTIQERAARLSNKSAILIRLEFHVMYILYNIYRIDMLKLCYLKFIFWHLSFLVTYVSDSDCLGPGPRWWLQRDTLLLP